MAQRFDLLSARESNGKTYFTKCGAMFPNKAGDGFNIVLDVFPAPQDGQFRLIAKVPQDRDGQRQEPQRRAGNATSGRSGWDDDSDSIPF